MGDKIIIETTKSLSYKDVLEKIKFRDIEHNKKKEEFEYNSKWAQGEILFYRPGFSSRGVTISYDIDRFQIITMALSSTYDYELAFAFLKAIIELCAPNQIKALNRTIAVSKMGDVYSNDWIISKFNSDLQNILSYIKNKKTLVELSGPIRSFYLGIQLKGEFPKKELRQTLLNKIIRLQYIDESKYAIASVISVLNKNETKILYQTSLWINGRATLFPWVNYISLCSEKNHLFDIPHNKLYNLRIPQIRLLDEKHILIDSMTENEWKDFLIQMKKFAISKKRNLIDRIIRRLKFLTYQGVIVKQYN